MRTSRITISVGVTVTIFGTLASPLPATADPIRNSQWSSSYLKLADAHKISQGSGISVAVIDTGVFPHRDLVRNLKNGVDIGPDGDGTGKVDSLGHGTKMAGLIAGHGHSSGDGVLGVAPEAAIIPVKVAGKKNNSQNLPAGINWAAEAKAGVINVSGAAVNSRNLSSAVEAAIRADSIVVAASGNTSDDLRMAFPAALPDVLAVGAIDRSGKVAKFSITDSRVTLCAPGVEMVTTAAGNKYAEGNGTSQATAIVSGAAALVRARFPDLSAPEVVHRLTFTADDNGPPGKDDQCGYGVLNIVEALTADVPPLNAGGAASAQPGVSSAPGGNDVNSTGAVGQAPSESEDAGSDLSALIGVGSVAAVLVGLLAFVTVRKRRTSS